MNSSKEEKKTTSTIKKMLKQRVEYFWTFNNEMNTLFFTVT